MEVRHFLSQRHNKLCHFINYGLIIFWLAKTSKTIDLRTRLEINFKGLKPNS